MVRPVDEAIEEVKETDIVFDCPYCGKSLAIDYRGAGLTIPCSDCAREVEVPIPEGMELADIDSSDEEKEIRILNLRRSLAGADARIRALEKEVAALRTNRMSAEEIRAKDGGSFAGIAEKASGVRVALEESLKAIKEIHAFAVEGAPKSDVEAEAKKPGPEPLPDAPADEA